MRREEPMRKPSSTPVDTPSAKPAMVLQNVCSAWSVIGRAYCWSEARIAVGAGKMKSDTWKPRHTASQTMMITASTIHGDHFSSVRLFTAMSSLADAADVLAQLEHDLGEA